MNALMRVLTWNVRDLLGDPHAVARVIRSADADVVCLQEAPRWPTSRWRLSSLARSSGMLFVDGGRSAAGCALLASLRADIRDVRTERLPVEGRLARPRGAVIARVAPVGGVDVTLVVVHLGLHVAERTLHTEMLAVGLSQLRPGPIVVAGDFNEGPAGPAWTAWASRAADPSPQAKATFPARAPKHRIDAVLVGGLEVVEYDTWRADEADVIAGSDHRPVLAVISVPMKGASSPHVRDDSRAGPLPG